MTPEHDPNDSTVTQMLDRIAHTLDGRDYRGETDGSASQPHQTVQDQPVVQSAPSAEEGAAPPLFSGVKLENKVKWYRSKKAKGAALCMLAVVGVAGIRSYGSDSSIEPSQQTISPADLSPDAPAQEIAVEPANTVSAEEDLDTPLFGTVEPVDVVVPIEPVQTVVDSAVPTSAAPTTNPTTVPPTTVPETVPPSSQPEEQETTTTTSPTTTAPPPTTAVEVAVEPPAETLPENPYVRLDCQAGVVYFERGWTASEVFANCSEVLNIPVATLISYNSHIEDLDSIITGVTPVYLSPQSGSTNRTTTGGTGGSSTSCRDNMGQFYTVNAGEVPTTFLERVITSHGYSAAQAKWMINQGRLVTLYDLDVQRFYEGTQECAPRRSGYEVLFSAGVPEL